MASIGKIQLRTADFQPAAVGSSETTPIFNVKKGDLVLYAYAIKTILAAGSTTSTISVGDGGDVDRLVAVTDTETGSVGDIVAGVTAAFPYQYTADDTIDADYIIGATPGATNPKWRIAVAVMDMLPS